MSGTAHPTRSTRLPIVRRAVASVSDRQSDTEAQIVVGIGATADRVDFSLIEGSDLLVRDLTHRRVRSHDTAPLIEIRWSQSAPKPSRADVMAITQCSIVRAACFLGNSAPQESHRDRRDGLAGGSARGTQWPAGCGAHGLRLAINLKAPKALRGSFPPNLILLAGQVFE